MTQQNTLRGLSESLEKSEISAVELNARALARARLSPSVFIALNEGLASLAESIDRSRKKRKNRLPLAGIPITLKDLFDVRNEQTLAGSVVLGQSAAKPQDAEVVARLRAAGLLFLGRTNMSEFAFSGLGINAHHGTPLAVWDRQTGRIPGGSSSGSAVSVAEGIVVATLGSDTAGSCRVPASFNGVVGVKPSYGRLSLNGIFPLSPTSDAPGPLANDVDSCFILDQLMHGSMKPGDALPVLPQRAPSSLKFAIPESRVIDDLDDEVQRSFDSTIDYLRDAGATIEIVKMAAIDRSSDLFVTKPIVLYEAYQYHKQLLEERGDEFDPFVRARILTGAGISHREQTDRYRAKAELIEQFNCQFRQLGVDALLYPTTPCIPPALSQAEDPSNARELNLRCLRNTATSNYYDGCSISLPCHKPGNAPVGLMLSAMHGQDENLYMVAASVEKILSQMRATG